MPWQWFGNTIASGYFMMSVLMMVLLSVGEIIWSPKLYDYIATVAPKGQEGAYLVQCIELLVHINESENGHM